MDAEGGFICVTQKDSVNKLVVTGGTVVWFNCHLKLSFKKIQKISKNCWKKFLILKVLNFIKKV